jgi:hypothetical protein
MVREGDLLAEVLAAIPWKRPRLSQDRCRDRHAFTSKTVSRLPAEFLDALI